MSVPLRKVVAAVALVVVGFFGGASWANARAPERGSASAGDVPVVQPAPPGDPSCGGGQPSDADRSLT